ncbi:hypothetical protein [Pseudomonas sp. W2-17]|uniref:hypothetical protein n=1 Tax=Pseudomonas sp. W2-17 TaxID=3058039 RepID=UPI0034E06139
MPRKKAPEPVAEIVQPADVAPVATSANEVGLLDQRITDALIGAKTGGIPQGFIVAVLQAHALKETQALIA